YFPLPELQLLGVDFDPYVGCFRCRATRLLCVGASNVEYTGRGWLLRYIRVGVRSLFTLGFSCTRGSKIKIGAGETINHIAVAAATNWAQIEWNLKYFLQVILRSGRCGQAVRLLFARGQKPGIVHLQAFAQPTRVDSDNHHEERKSQQQVYRFQNFYYAIRLAAVQVIDI